MAIIKDHYSWGPQRFIFGALNNSQNFSETSNITVTSSVFRSRVAELSAFAAMPEGLAQNAYFQIWLGIREKKQFLVKKKRKLIVL